MNNFHENEFCWVFLTEKQLYSKILYVLTIFEIYFLKMCLNLTGTMLSQFDRYPKNISNSWFRVKNQLCVKCALWNSTSPVKLLQWAKVHNKYRGLLTSSQTNLPHVRCAPRAPRTLLIRRLAPWIVRCYIGPWWRQRSAVFVMYFSTHTVLGLWKLFLFCF